MQNSVFNAELFLLHWYCVQAHAVFLEFMPVIPGYSCLAAIGGSDPLEDVQRFNAAGGALGGSFRRFLWEYDFWNVVV